MKKLKMIVPVMIVVFLLAVWILNKDYSILSLYIRILIASGGALLSGVLTYFLSRDEIER